LANHLHSIRYRNVFMAIRVQGVLSPAHALSGRHRSEEVPLGWLSLSFMCGPLTSWQAHRELYTPAVLHRDWRFFRIGFRMGLALVFAGWVCWDAIYDDSQGVDLFKVTGHAWACPDCVVSLGTTAW
jgi:hypothetical protein